MNPFLSTGIDLKTDYKLKTNPGQQERDKKRSRDENTCSSGVWTSSQESDSNMSFAKDHTCDANHSLFSFAIPCSVDIAEA